MDKETAERKEPESKVLVPSKYILSEAKDRSEYGKVYIEGVDTREEGQFFQLVTFDPKKGEFARLRRVYPETEEELSKYHEFLNYQTEILNLPGKEIPANTTIGVAKKKDAPEAWSRTSIIGVVQKSDRRYFLLKIKEENAFKLVENTGQATDDEFNTYRNLLGRTE
jgi:hypothetical protein